VIVKPVHAKPEVETPYNPGSISDQVGTTQGVCGPRDSRSARGGCEARRDAPQKD